MANRTYRPTCESCAKEISAGENVTEILRGRTVEVAEGWHSTTRVRIDQTGLGAKRIVICEQCTHDYVLCNFHSRKLRINEGDEAAYQWYHKDKE